MNYDLDMLVTPALIIAAGMAVILLTRYLSRRYRAGAERQTDIAAPELDGLFFPASVLAVLYLAYRWASLPPSFDRIAHFALVAAGLFLVIRFLTAAIRRGIRSYFQKRGAAEKTSQARGLVIVSSGLLWTIGFIAILNNLGFDVTAILAGLGVGGIAIALAAQTILGDLFNYFVILFDQPFEPGDFIVVDDKMGTIEYIGLKTTRLRSLQGEQIIFSNTSLTNSRIHNYKRMAERRVLFKFGVVYETSTEKLEAIPGLVKQVIDCQGLARFDRAHFASFGDYSLNFESVYYVLSSDYNQYMDAQQAINLTICEQFRKEGIEFAFPTYSVNVGTGVPGDTTHSRKPFVRPNGRTS